MRFEFIVQNPVSQLSVGSIQPRAAVQSEGFFQPLPLQ